MKLHKAKEKVLQKAKVKGEAEVKNPRKKDLRIGRSSAFSAEKTLDRLLHR